MKRVIIPTVYLLLTFLGFIYKSYTLFIGLLISSLILGPFFCGWLCPFGFLQDLLTKLARVLKLPRLTIPKPVHKYLKFLRYLVFVLIVVGIGIAIVLDSPYRTFGAVMTGNLMFISTVSWITLGAILVLSLFVERPFCRYLCSEGARYGAVSLFRVFSIKRDEESCVNCKKCDKLCPMQIEVSRVKHVRDAQCINCLECIKSCPVKGCLTYKFVLKRNKQQSNEVVEERREA